MKTPILSVLCLILLTNGHSQSLHRKDSLYIDDLTLPSIVKDPDHHERKEFVYWAAKGQALALAHQYDESNLCFEKAYFLKIDQRFRKLDLKEESYEDAHEVVMLLYYKVINYLEIGDQEGALIECRRLDELIHPRFPNDFERELIDEDPLVHTLMGIVFEMNKEYDDAAISYRKAEQLFQADYNGLFSKHVPELLKGRNSELSELSSTGNSNISVPLNHPFGQLIFIWNNGQSPKEIITGHDFMVKNLNGDSNSNDLSIEEFEDCLGNSILSFYKFSRPFYQYGELEKDNKKVPCELLEDVSWYSVKALQERLKTNGIHVWRKGSNWSTVPGSIYFTIVPLTEGANNFQFTTYGQGSVSKSESFAFDGDGKNHFHLITTMESLPLKVSSNKTYPIPLLRDFLK